MNRAHPTQAGTTLVPEFRGSQESPALAWGVPEPQGYLNLRVVALWGSQTQQQEENTPGNTKNLFLSSSTLLSREEELQPFPVEPQLNWNLSFLAASIPKRE